MENSLKIVIIKKKKISITSNWNAMVSILPTTVKNDVNYIVFLSTNAESFQIKLGTVHLSFFYHDSNRVGFWKIRRNWFDREKLKPPK